LIAAALAHGGHDNVSAVIVKYDGPDKHGLNLNLPDRAVGWFAVLGGVILAVLLAGVVVWIRHKR
jgi:hypothetical protein